MSEPRAQIDHLKAVLRTAQDLTLLQTDEDVWREFEEVVVGSFGADVVAFYECDLDGAIASRSCSLATQAACESLFEAVRAPVRQVLDSGSLVSVSVRLPEDCAVAILPLRGGDEGRCVFLVGRRSRQPYGQSELDMYLAVAGLLENTLSRLAGQRRSKDQTAAASHYARSLLEASLDPLVTISAAGKITDVNAATEEVTGFPREQLVGTDFSDYFTEPDEARAGYRRVFDEGQVIDYPLAIRHASGKVTDVLYNASVYRDEAGEVVGIFAAARDITERKRAEEALLRAEAALRAEKDELARSNAELEQFAYVASHDLQEPLRMVASYTQLLARRYAGRLDADADEFIGFAVDGANRMQQLIMDLLAFSRVGTRGKPLIPMESQAAYDEAVANLALAIEDSSAEVDAGPLPVVSGDHQQLVQLFQNLIGNAIKFHGKDAPRVHVSTQQRDDEWVFSVADNGIGIDPQYFERIFVIFQRLQGRRDFPGTGIGLALCQKIVTRHQGRIWVESEPGHGTTFHFTIPTQGERS